MSKKFVYKFSEGNATMRNLLGGKGANLAEMNNIGLPVPPGFTITTEACTQYYNDGRKINDEIMAEIMRNVDELEAVTGKKFGDKENPLLVSVRSGARASMPGMMDTILNLGLNEDVVNTIAEKSGNPRWAWDCYRRFIQMFSDVVMEVSKKDFEALIDKLKEENGYEFDTDLSADDLKDLANQFKAVYHETMTARKAEAEAAGKEFNNPIDFPDDPKTQLYEAIRAVFRSWDNPRAQIYRMDHDIPYSWGTAVNVMMMAFGNMGDRCGTGVCFSRNPATGENKYFYGEFLINAQGEDVVAGVRTPQQISKAGSIEWAQAQGISEEERLAKYPSLEEYMPEVFKELTDTKNNLEKHYHDMQDMEFTIENEKLYMLQTRNGKRTAAAAIRIACDLIDEGIESEEDALMSIDAGSLNMLLHPAFDAAELKKAVPVGHGIAASPGAGVGHAYFTADDAVEHGKNGENVILVRLETSPEDIEGMKYSKGILTVRGGQTSHAAVVARGMGTCCVSGCGDIKMDEENKRFTLNGKTYHEGDILSLDGSTGNIYDVEIKTVPADPNGGYFGRIMELSDKYKRLKIRTNADTPHDAQQAASFGAEGIGLCRTEHMFFDPARIGAFREMICAETKEQRVAALDKIEPMQQSDFEGLFEALKGQPVCIRFLDPPLHEFVPTAEADIEALAAAQGRTADYIKQIVADLHEFNPMMGHRGCRLTVSYPEIAVMQTSAVIKAAINVKKAHADWTVEPEIMIPLVGDSKEMKFVKDIVVKTADAIIADAGSDLKYTVGTMIEIPRAALTAGDIAKEAEFFCFGTNDLTQMTFGFSRDDAGKFLKDYYANKIYDFDPFSKLDETGVGRLMTLAVKEGKVTRPELHCGICGEHGGDPASIEFCDSIGLDYVSCSPFRVPIARLAAAQANIKHSK